MRACDQNSGRLRRCAVLILIAAFFLLPLVGCKHTPRQTMTGLWESVPQVRWSGNRPEPTTPAKAEPSVGANVPASVAVPHSQPTDSNVVDTTVEGAAPRSTPSLPGIVGAGASAKPTFTERATTTQANALQSQAAAESPVDGSGQEQLERLEAALDQGAEPRHPGSTHDVRVRVDALLEKSRRLFDLGELREARHAAKVAHDLGDSARLDYSPDEERPIDLVLQIDDRMREAAEQANDSAPNATEGLAKDSSPSVETVTPNSVAGTSNVGSGTAAPLSAKPGDVEPTAKPRKDWTQSLFRPYRKTTTAAAPVASLPPSVQISPEAPSVQLGLDTESAIPEANDGAVVQANRSLKLSTTPPVPPANEPDSVEDLPGRTESSHRDFDSTTEPAESGVAAASFAARQPDLASNLRSWRANSTASESPIIEEPSPTPADLSDVEPLTPFRDMAGQVTSQADEEMPVTPCRTSDYGWPIAIILFIGCSVVAIFWYRRGAV